MAEKKQTKEQSEKVEEKDPAQELLEHNLRFYEQGRSVPQDAKKEIRAGRLKGMSDINPMWRMKRLTEIFGPCGFGWKYVIEKQWTENYGAEVKAFCNVLLYVRDPETKEWSEPIPGNGGSSIVSQERNGTYVNDEGYKMALTDALSIAMKPLGIGADIWYGEKATGHNESKYEAATREQPQQSQQPQQPAAQVHQQPAAVFTGAQLQSALELLSKVSTREEFNNVWIEVRNTCPALCQQGTEFYNACMATNKRLQQQ